MFRQRRLNHILFFRVLKKVSLCQIKGGTLASPNAGPHNDSQGLWQRRSWSCKIMWRREGDGNDQCLSMGFLLGYTFLYVWAALDLNQSPQIERSRPISKSEPENCVTICSSVGREVIPHWCRRGSPVLLNQLNREVQDKLQSELAISFRKRLLFEILNDIHILGCGSLWLLVRVQRDRDVYKPDVCCRTHSVFL